MLLINRILLILSLSFLPGILKATSAFTLANEAYQNKDFTQAIKLYEESLKRSQSLEQHFNLANAYYENKQFGPAILHYEKAWTFNPMNNDILINLQKAYDAVQKHYETHGRLSPPGAKTFTWIAIIVVAIAFIAYCLILYFFPKNFFLKTIIWICCFLSIGLIGVNLLYSAQTHWGIIIKNEAPLRVSPTTASPVTTLLAEGTKAKTIKTKEKPNGFLLIKTPNHQEGWISTSDFGLIWD